MNPSFAISISCYYQALFNLALKLTDDEFWADIITLETLEAQYQIDELKNSEFLMIFLLEDLKNRCNLYNMVQA